MLLHVITTTGIQTHNLSDTSLLQWPISNYADLLQIM